MSNAGYHKIDPEMVLPAVRAEIERNVNLIARGKASFGDVVQHALNEFHSKFSNFVSSIGRLVALFKKILNMLSAADSQAQHG